MVKYPYIISWVVVICFWLLPGILVDVILRANSVPEESFLWSACVLVPLLSAFSAWEWLAPIRKQP